MWLELQVLFHSKAPDGLRLYSKCYSLFYFSLFVSLLSTSDTPIFIVCASSVALVSALMMLSAIALSAGLNHPMVRSAGGITLVVYIGFLFFKLALTMLLMYDGEQLEGICLVRPIVFLIGATGSSAVLFCRMLR